MLISSNSDGELESKSARIALPSSGKSISVGIIPSTILTTSIPVPIIYPILNTFTIIISIPIFIIIVVVVALITVTLASATASTTASTSCALILGLLYLGLVTWMQAIWSMVFAATIITWDFSHRPCCANG